MSENYPVPRNRYERKNKNFPWIFVVDGEDRIFDTIHKGRSFESKWLRLDPDGKVTIKKGYAWDGCTPKWSILGLFVIGTPDGHVKIKDENENPWTHDASMVHDAFYQYLDTVPVSKKDIDRQFYLMLKEVKFPLARIYYFFVSVFGGRAVKKNINQHSIIKEKPEKSDSLRNY